MGGLGGALLGNWLYDSFSRNRPQGGEQPSPGSAGEPGTPYNDQYESTGASDWGDSGGDQSGPAEAEGDGGGADGGDFGGGGDVGGGGDSGGGDW